MNLRALAVVALAPLTLWSAQGHALSVADVGRQATQEGLAAAHSRYLDKVYLRRDLDLSAFRTVLIEPVRVEFDERWVKDSRYAMRSVGEENMKRLADGIAADAYANIAEAFRERGFAIATAPGPGVLRLSPYVSELYVNAPERQPHGPVRTFTKEVGDATLVLDARDSTTGAVVARVAHRGTARHADRFTWTTDVTNRIWFGELIRRWADECAAHFRARAK